MQLSEHQDYPATLLDADNQPLSTGKVRFCKADKSVLFWFHAGETTHPLKVSASSVQVLPGHKVEVHNMRAHRHDNPPFCHYHLDFDPAKIDWVD